MNGFMGMGMAMGAGGANTAALFEAGAKQQQAQQQQMLERLGPEALRQFGGMVQNAQQQPQPNQEETVNGGQEQQG